MIKQLPGVVEEGSVQLAGKPDYKKLSEEYCGSWVRVINPSTGRFDRKPHTCKKWRKCSNCLEHHEVPKVTNRLKYYGDHKYLNVKFMSNEDWRSFSKSHRDKSLYMRVPNDENECMVLFDESVVIGDSVMVAEILTWNWGEILLSMPENKRITGDLGKAPKPQHDATCAGYEVVVVNESDFNKEEFSKIEKESMKKAILATATENPKTVLEVEKSIQKRTSAYTTILRGKGVECFVLPRTVTIVSIREINWFSENVMDTIVKNKLQGWELVDAELRENRRKYLAENPYKPIYD